MIIGTKSDYHLFAYNEVYVPDGGTRQTSSDVNSLLPLLMCNGGLFGNIGQNGGGCLGPLANMVNNNDGRDLIMQAINGNGNGAAVTKN